MGLAIADIKRFVNDGLTPINALIGAPSDAANKNGSLHAKSAYLVSKVDDMSTKINNIQAGISNIGGEKHYQEDGDDIIFSWSADYIRKNMPNGNFYNNIIFSDVFYPKYDGVLEMHFRSQYSKSAGSQEYFALVNTWEIYSSAKVQSGQGSALTASNATLKFNLINLNKSPAFQHMYNKNNILTSNDTNYNDIIFSGREAFDVNGKISSADYTSSIWNVYKKVYVKKGYPIRLMYAPYVFVDNLSVSISLTGKEAA